MAVFLFKKLTYMSKITRSKRKTPFVQIDKRALQDIRLSWKCKGLLSYLLSLPDNWQIYITELSKHSKCGRAATTSAMKELIKYGYIKRTEVRNEKGHFKGFDYTVYDYPKAENRISDKPKAENRISENQTLIRTNNNNKEINNTLLNKERVKEKNTPKEKELQPRQISDSFSTSLDITLNDFKFSEEFSAGLQESILSYWKYMQEKKGPKWGSVTTIKAQLQRFQKLIKEFTPEQITESINECIERGNISFNPINRIKKTQQNEKRTNNSTAESKSLNEHFDDYLQSGESATANFFNNVKWEDC
jgi:predicted transcriptional regulator